jgi:hypothetical protein
VSEDKVEQDLRDAIGELVGELEQQTGSADLAARLEWLIDVLVMRGHLTPGHRALVKRIKAEGTQRGVVHLATFRDKHAVASAEIDCAARLHLCQARCCTFAVSLSPQDVREGKLRWSLHEPYLLERDRATGYCQCMDGAGGCTVYEDRPGTCRAYDCRHDGRVWIDFEARLPAPMPAGVVPRFPVTPE